MDNYYGTTETAKQYMKSVLKNVFLTSWLTDVTNQDYENPSSMGDKSIKAKNQTFTVTSLFSNGWSSYSGSDLTFAEVKEVVSTLTIDTFNKVAEKIPSLSIFASSVKDPKSPVMQSQTEKLKVLLAKEFLKSVVDAGAGNWIGTDYTTGTVTVDVTTGVVTGVGTTFTAAMVGRPFRAAGHSKWYRVASRSSNTAIVIENDSDDTASSYDGGAIGAGATYTIQCNTKVAVTSATIAGKLALMSQVLDNASYGDNDETTVPQSDRFVFLPATAKSVLLQAPEFNVDIEKVHDATVKEGKVARAYGMDIYIVKDAFFKQIDGTTAGDNTTGFACPFGQKSWLTFGMGFVDPVVVIPASQNQTNFGDLIKGMFGHGKKVADIRRHCGGVMYATFSVS